MTSFGRFFCATVALLLSTSLANAAEIKVLIAGALQNGIRPLAADFEKQTGNKVTVTAVNPALVTNEFNAHQFDVVASAVPTIGELSEGAKLQPGSTQHLARTGIGVSIKEGAPKPDLSTIEAFKKAVTNAKSIIYTDPNAPNASGGNTQHILANAGLLDVVKKKGFQEGLAPGRERIAKGEYEIGFFNVSEATARGVVLAGPVPAPLQMYLNYDIALARNPAAKNEAAAFVKFVTTRAAGTRWTAAGLEQLDAK